MEDTTAYTPDESEYNDLNTDRELFALRAISKSLERISEKKSLLYFSGGISRDGIENQASLRAAINAAVRANLAIYSVDTRGLQAVSPLGDASTGSLRGTGAYNGGALQNNMNANFATQEVMATLSSDTGGKAFFDSNDFAPAFAQIQHDTSAYYVIGFHSTNPARDGKYRRLTIKINRPDLKLEYRPGYYAPADFKHSGKEDRERELEEQLASDLPATDMAVYLDAMYFRLDENRFYVPVSLIVPGSQIPFVKGGDNDKATLDIIGEVIDEVKRPIGRARETVKLNLDPSLQARQKNIQYTTSFNLPPGKYHLKFVVRENQTGRMGSFEADITLPEMKKVPLKMSSIVLAAARQPSKQDNPLVRDGQEYVPNISHVFRQDQHLYLLYEVYSPAREKPADNQPKGTKPGINLLSSLELIQGSTKVYETPLVQAKAVNVAGPRCRFDRTRRAAGGAQARFLCLPVECDRRRRRQLRLSALCGAGARVRKSTGAGLRSRRVGIRLQALRFSIGSVQTGRGGRERNIARSALFPGDQSNQKDDNHRSAKRDQDGINQSARRRNADCLGDKAAHYRADDSQNDVDDEAVSATLHQFSSEPARDKTNENPPQHKHVFLLGSFLRRSWNDSWLRPALTMRNDSCA